MKKSPEERRLLARTRAERKKLKRKGKQAGRERHRRLREAQQAAAIEEVEEVEEVEDKEVDDETIRKQWYSGFAVQYPLP